MADLDEDWELAPTVASPAIRNLLREPFFWDSGDDNSPLGNDTGADVLHLFREWLSDNPSGNAEEFFDELLEKWDVSDCSWVLPNGPELERALEDAHYSILTWDDIAIALGFAQMILQSSIDSAVASRALLALERQATETVIAFRGWVDPVERARRLALMRSAVLSAPQK